MPTCAAGTWQFLSVLLTLQFQLIEANPMKFIKTALLCLAMGSSYTFADCAAPTVPAMPDGSKSSMDEMLAGKTAVSTFQKDNATYLDCLSQDMEAAKNKLKASNKDEAAAAQADFTKLTEAYNSAVTAEETLANKFNAEIRAFKEVGQ